MAEKVKSGALAPGGGGFPGTKVPVKDAKDTGTCETCPTECGVCDPKGHCSDHCKPTAEDVREWN